MKNNILENLSPEQKSLNTRIFDLILGRVLKRVYLGLKEDDKEEMEKVFLSENNKNKRKLVKNYLPNFEKLFKGEAKKLKEEIKEEIAKEAEKQ